MSKRYWRIGLAVLLVGLLAFGGALVGLANTLPNSISWEGYPQGVDSLDCNKVGDGPRTEAGWIHWVLNGNQVGVTAAELVLGGTGSGTYQPEGYGPGAMQFFTPYFELEGLTAVVWYAGTLGSNSSLVVSDYCPGQRGCMEIIKYFEGWDDVLGFDAATMLPTSITVTIKGNTAGLSYPTTGTDVTINRQYDADAGEYFWYWKRCDLIPGSYNVSKTALAGWDLEILPAGGNLTVVAGTEPGPLATATLTNTYKPGCMEIIKYFEGWDDVLGFDAATMLPTSITVTIKGNTAGLSYPTTGTDVTINRTYDPIADEYSWYWKRCELIPGSYNVSKTALAGWDLEILPVGGDLTVIAGPSPGPLATATLTNTYKPGCLTITKVWLDAYGEEFEPGELEALDLGDINIVIFGPSFEVTGQSDVLEANKGWTLTICNLIPGDYTVLEQNVPAGWTVSYDPSNTVEVTAGAVAGEIGILIQNCHIPPKCETAMVRMYDDPNDFTYKFARHPWFSYVKWNENQGKQTFYFYAAQYYRVGEVDIWRDGGYLYVDVKMDAGYTLDELHINVQTSANPQSTAFGRYPYRTGVIEWKSAWDDKDLYIFVHGVVCGYYDNMEAPSGGMTLMSMESAVIEETNSSNNGIGAGGMPAVHGVENMGELASGLAQSYPGAVADHMGRR